jgi:hypothetical protein
VAQALDYGASLWRHANFNELLSFLDGAGQKQWGMSCRDKLAEFYSLDEDGTDALIESMRRNLAEGNLKFVVLMDKLEDRLKDLITYINQNSQFDIYAVLIEFYKHEEYEIVIPKLYGAEVKKAIPVGGGGVRQVYKWDEAKLLADAHGKLTREAYDAFEKLYQFSKEQHAEINFGTGAGGTFSPVFKKFHKKSLFTLGTDGRLLLNFGWVFRHKEKAAIDLKGALERIGYRFEDNWKVTRPSVPLDEWVPKADLLIQTLRELLQ